MNDWNEQMGFQELNEVAVTFDLQLAPLDEVSRSIHEQAQIAAQQYLVAEATLLDAIMQVDRDETYRKLGENYLTPYCEKYLGLSSDVAAIFVRVARKSAEVPALRAAVAGGLPISKAKTIASTITVESEKEWIHRAQTLSKANLEQAVVIAQPNPKRADRLRPTGENRNRMEFELSDETLRMQKRATDLICQKLGRSPTLAEVQNILLAEYLLRHDPVEKAKRAKLRKIKSDQSRDRSTKTSSAAAIEGPRQTQDLSLDGSIPENIGASPTSPLQINNEDRTPPAKSTDVFHQVQLRDLDACRARFPDGSICGETRWIEIHHILPKSQGGPDTIENLITLCGSHHRIAHRT